MPPKKKPPRLFDKKTDSVDGVQYTLYEDGMLKVGTDADRVTVVRVSQGWCRRATRCEPHDLPEGPHLHRLAVRPQGRELRQIATGPYGAQRAKGSGLSFFSEDSHNIVLDAQGLDSD